MPLSQGNILQPSCSRKACRNLFGPVDHEQLQNDFQSLMKAEWEEAQRRWNFDFETETPLEGDYRWEKISHINVLSPQDLLSYSKENSCAGDKSLSAPVLLKRHEKMDNPGQGSLEAESSRQLKRKQTSIKDFYSSKRRTIPYKANP
ncbi:cyclin-dependent kinase inhibitor 1 [Eublepharis macularius]|uniref:Cyclin-dependent kinase inhibitor 1 n=1 Tax=Eublepharis macularius TaxID=481883 RepID=A0AA97JG84_EUBMA|nr:cyclin-dependent kinase inhibitor 1 [Eublepharis macularius]